ncbi:MAG: deoxyribodipyrimidine photo-lyase [Xanthomonadales bacterium]|nr:deoxyribodipyrimidine photo-lyase [Xanthomonadales bacterium]
MPMTRTALIWLRRDLRLHDHRPLQHAIEQRLRPILVYVHAPDEEAPWQPGGASRWWLHRSLQALSEAVDKLGGRLILRRGPTLETLRTLIAESDAKAVYWQRLYDPATIERDSEIKRELRADGLDSRSFGGYLLSEPDAFSTGSGDPYRVFTPYWRRLQPTLDELAPPLPAPDALPSCELSSLSLDELGLLPRIHWYQGMDEAWTPGECGAIEELVRFADEALDDYGKARDLPAQPGTSRLSPHLHFGEISPAQIVDSLRGADGAAPFLRELGWRDFSYNLLRHFPQTTERNLNPRFDAFPWADENAEQLQAWQRGRTGIPIVDAGMRELWHTGWMHNRVRMLVASLLTKNLRLHWLHGARWFWDTLVDADLANNTQGWQWTAGTGADAAPYFRIFNPVTQGERFDPDGAYVRRWVPELKDLPNRHIHQPWSAGGVQGYPKPIVDLGETRAEALAAFKALD